MENLKFFVNESTKLLKSDGLDTLILYVTSRCNAKCNFCFYGDELNHVSELGLPQIVAISEKLKSLNGLLIGGGEPFLRTDLFDIIAAFEKNCGIGVVQIPTNGFFTDRVVAFVSKVTTAFPELNLAIQVSLDAIGEKHDAVRELKGCFERAQNTIKALKAQRKGNMRLRVLVVSVLTPQTIPHCRELAEYIREKLDPDYHWFEPVRDMPAMQKDLNLTPETVAFLYHNLEYYLKKVPGSSSSVYASRFFNKLIMRYALNNFSIAYDNFIHKKKWPMRCIAGRKMAVLYPDGMLAACELRQERVHVKDFDFDVNRAIKDEVFGKVREDTLRHACDCTHGCFIPTSVRYSPWELFSLARRFIFTK